MIYEKMPVILLSTLATSKEGSTNAFIASYILNNPQMVKKMGIREMANACHVGLASISRFCREIGLQDFKELKDMIGSEDFQFECANVNLSPQERTAQWTNEVTKAIQTAISSLDLSSIQELCQDILQYQKVSCFGLLKAENAAINLQTDLLMMGKDIYTTVSYADQMQHILSAPSDELIILFSYTGTYFEPTDQRRLMSMLSPCKIWMVTGGKTKLPKYIHHFISFSSNLQRIDHPFLLEACSSIIAREYACICAQAHS